VGWRFGDLEKRHDEALYEPVLYELRWEQNRIFGGVAIMNGLEAFPHHWLWQHNAENLGGSLYDAADRLAPRTSRPHIHMAPNAWPAG
jgi:hypothetical protein